MSNANTAQLPLSASPRHFSVWSYLLFDFRFKDGQRCRRHLPLSACRLPPSTHDRQPPGSNVNCLLCLHMGDDGQVENVAVGRGAIASNLTNDRCNVCGLCHSVCRVVFAFAVKCPCLCLSICFGPKNKRHQQNKNNKIK